MENKMARPKLGDDDRKDMYVRVRVTQSERAAITQNWRAAGDKTEAAFIRRVLLESCDGNSKKTRR
jgi:hypothetical protein